MDPRTLPEPVRSHARAHLDGDAVPAEPRTAASTVLLRPGAAARPGRVELFLIRRHARMAFAADMAVYPGGGVDPRDSAVEAGSWAGPSPAAWADRLGVDEDTARSVLCAAVRETFEESGVLLAGPDARTVVTGTLGAAWEQDRQRLEAHELSMSELLRRRGLVLRTDLLEPWSCWVTPTFEPRRYRSWFFVAVLPDGQQPRDVSTESQGTLWCTVADALRAADGPMAMLPPQYCITAQLYEFATPPDVLAAARTRTPATVAPTAVVEDGEVRLELPAPVLATTDAVNRALAGSAPAG